VASPEAEEISRILEAGAAGGSGSGISRDQKLLLQRYLALVTEWSRRLRLTGVRTPAERARVLILETLTALPYLPIRGMLIDLGSGAGVPGIPIAVVRPEVRVVLVEASRNKAGFLQVAVRELALENAEVVHGRAEALGHDPRHRERYHAVTARALGPLRVLVEYALPLLMVGGVGVFPKGRAAADEVAAASRALHFLGGEADLRIVASAPQSPVIVVRKVAPTPPAYPRRPGVPSRRPL
jgi:16S rRNA (guanine527-N7)-methyltransferase